MLLHVLFAQRRERYTGEFGPEAVATATEYQTDENPDLMQGLYDEAKASMGKDIIGLCWVSMRVNADTIRGRLLPAELPPIQADLK